MTTRDDAINATDDKPPSSVRPLSDLGKLRELAEAALDYVGAATHGAHIHGFADDRPSSTSGDSRSGVPLRYALFQPVQPAP